MSKLLVFFRKKRIQTALAAIILGTSFAAKDALGAEWTVLIYMNGKNNLETDAIRNFESIASIGSTDKVNIVVQMGRPQPDNRSAADAENLYGGWSGVNRFLVKKDMKPVPESALKVPGMALNAQIDMAKPDALYSFLSWGKQQYPATRYMVLIWSHGQGWRAPLPKTANAKLTAKPFPKILGGHRSIVGDDDTQSILYNSEVAATVTQVFGGPQNPNQKLDLLGFDACLMGMMETAYGVRDAVKTMVASTDVEPGAGWPYELWIYELTQKPWMTDTELGRAIVDSYRKQYQSIDDYTTLSAVKPSGVASAAAALSDLSLTLLQGRLASERPNIAKARAAMKPYGNWYSEYLNTSVDLVAFLRKYQAETSDPTIKQRIGSLASGIESQVLRNYAHRKVVDGSYGGTGLAIYFPESKATFMADTERAGYIKTNTDRPVAFVQRERWADLLHGYWGEE